MLKEGNRSEEWCDGKERAALKKVLQWFWEGILAHDSLSHAFSSVNLGFSGVQHVSCHNSVDLGATCTYCTHIPSLPPLSKNLNEYSKW